MLQDLRIGIRMLGRSPGASFLTLICLTLGIAATTSVLSWMEGILLRPFPKVARQERMFAITGTDPNGRTDISWPDLKDLEKNCSLTDAFVAEHIASATLSIGARAEKAMGSVVSSNYFDVLGVHPVLGRTFRPSEDSGRNAHPVTVISYEAWQNRYHGDPAIIGRQQRLNGTDYTIVGVAPEGFYGTFVGYSFQFWVPASMEEAFEGGGYKLDNRGERWIEGFAFLRPGVTAAQAQAEISLLATRLDATYPATNRGCGFRLWPLSQTPFNNAGALLPTLRISLVVACLVLIIACANAGNLLLVRALGRRQEMTVRLAMGAGRGRLVRQLLTEALILATLAAACGLFLANLCRNAIRLLFRPMPAGIVVHLPARIDWRVLALSAAVCLAATVVCGLVPAWQAGSVDLAGAMKTEASFREAPQPYFYTPLRQGTSPGDAIQIRTRLGPEAMANALARQVKSLDASLAAGELISMREQIDRTSWSQRAAITLLTVFGGVALLLASAGLYGVMSCAVSESRRELGLRIALGAEARDLLWMVMRYGLAVSMGGIAAGVVVAAGTTRLMGDFLYKVSPRDPAAFGAAFAVTAVAALAACLIPAFRVMQTDPVRALRAE